MEMAARFFFAAALIAASGCARFDNRELPARESVCMMDTCFREQRPLDRQNLPLKGADVEEKVLIQSYGVALYAPGWVKEENEILSSQVPKSLIVEYERNIELKDFVIYLEQGLPEELDPSVQEGFAKIAKNVFPVEAEDRQEFIYEPDKGTLVLQNGKPKTIIASRPFARTFFKFWLDRHNKGNQLLRPGFKL
jgi:hypothetical protein